jgi:hypothetical protein
MTLSTLKTMNVQMSDLRDSLLIRTPPAAAAEAASMGKAAAELAEPASGESAAAEAARPALPPGVDPLQWWGALTKQFTELAAAAIKDGGSGAAKGGVGAAPGLDASAAPAPARRKAAARPAAKARRAAPGKRP